jgi:hypothetical protein
LATGGGFTTRQLYTDGSETIFNAQRPIILNGISELATRGDLLDRSIVVSLPRLTPGKRRDECQFWSEFDAAKPRLLGAILDALKETLKELPNVRLWHKPRMADFAMFGVAVERAIGWTPGTFLRSYDANREKANCAAIEASPVGLAVLSLIDASAAFEGTATDLLRELCHHRSEGVNARAWPESPWNLGRILRRLAPNLRSVGIELEFYSASDRNKTRIVRVSKRASDASGPSEEERQVDLQTYSEVIQEATNEHVPRH